MTNEKFKIYVFSISLKKEITNDIKIMRDQRQHITSLDQKHPTHYYHSNTNTE